MNVEPKTLKDAREDLGMKPLVEPATSKVALLPESLRWFFLAWAFTILFGILAQNSYLWLSISALIIAVACYILSFLRATSRTFVSYRHPYRD